MTQEQTPTQQQAEETVRPSRVGRLVLTVVILAGTAGAFGIASLTFDSTLSPLQRQARAEIRGLEGYFKSFHRITGRFPSQAENFYPLLQVGLLKEMPVDPWGRAYQYRMDGGKGYVLSYGSDGLSGGSGEAADLISGGVLNNAILGTPEQQQEAARGGQP